MIFGILSSHLLTYVRANHLVILGTALTTLGAGLFSHSVSQGIPNKGVAAVYLIIFGAGQGFSTQNSFLCAQAHIPEGTDAKIMSNLPAYFHRIGGSILVAILSSVYKHNLGSGGMNMGGMHVSKLSSHIATLC